MASAISFNNESIVFVLKEKNKYKSWLKKIAQKSKFEILELNYIFCSDAHLHKINMEYLNHDDYTDIITFDNSDGMDGRKIEGDIFISIDRVKENAIKFSVPFQSELNRVMAHGLLHLIGFKDKQKKDILVMREMEEQCVKMFARS